MFRTYPNFENIHSESPSATGSTRVPARSAKTYPAFVNEEESKIMRAMRAEGFRGYQDLKLVDTPKPQVSEGRVLVKIAAAGVTPLEHTILSGG